MDYYERREQAFNKIDKLVKNKIKKENIIYDISKNFGLSRKAVLEMIRIIKEANGSGKK